MWQTVAVFIILSARPIHLGKEDNQFRKRHLLDNLNQDGRQQLQTLVHLYNRQREGLLQPDEVTTLNNLSKDVGNWITNLRGQTDGLREHTFILDTEGTQKRLTEVQDTEEGGGDQRNHLSKPVQYIQLNLANVMNDRGDTEITVSGASEHVGPVRISTFGDSKEVTHLERIERQYQQPAGTRLEDADQALQEALNPQQNRQQEQLVLG